MTFGVDSDSECFFDYFGGFELVHILDEIEQEEITVDGVLEKVIRDISDSEFQMSTIEDGLKTVFYEINECIERLSLKEVGDFIETLMKSIEHVELSALCKRLLVSNFIEINLKLQTSLSESQIEQYPKHQEWQAYFKRFNHLFKVDEEEWEEICFDYIQNRSQSPLYSFDLFTSHLDALTFLVVAGREEITWADYEKYYDKLFEKYLNRLLGSKFGEIAIKQYALVENGREVSLYMGNVIGKYIIRSSTEVSTVFKLIDDLRENRKVSDRVWLLIMKAITIKMCRKKVFTIVEYDQLIRLFLTHSSREENIIVWNSLQSEIIAILKKQFIFYIEAEQLATLNPLKSLEEFEGCRKIIEEKIALWSHFEKLDPSIKGNKNHYARFILCSIAVHLQFFSSEQIIECFTLFQDFLKGRKLSPLAKKMLLAIVFRAIDIEGLRNGGSSTLIEEYFTKSGLFDESFWPTVIKNGGKFLHDLHLENREPYPLIQTLAKLLKVTVKELLFRIAPGIVEIESFKKCCSQAFDLEWGNHPLTESEILIIKDVIESSKLSSSALALIIVMKGFNLSSQVKLTITERILDRALNQKKIKHGELFFLFRLLVAPELEEEKEGVIERLGDKIESLLRKRFSLRELMKINSPEGAKFALSSYYDLSQMFDWIIGFYGFEKEKFFPIFQFHWLQECAYSLKMIKIFANKTLNEKRVLLRKRQISSFEMLGIEMGLSQFKEKILCVMINCYEILNTHSKVYKEKADRLLIPFINQCLYEKPLMDEPCLTVRKDQLSIFYRMSP